MLSILDRYIGATVLRTSLMSLIVLTGLSGLIRFVEQLKSVGRGNYEVLDAALFVFYSIPRDIEVFFPMAALLGGLIGMGVLASNSELIVMQAAGRSKLNIAGAVMKTAIIMMIAVIAIGEWVAPPMEAKGRLIRAQEISGGSLISAQRGVWAKDGDDFINISEVEDTGRLNGVLIYDFDGKQQLDKVTYAQTAVFNNDAWRLNNVVETQLTEQEVIENRFDSTMWRPSLTPDKLGVVTIKPESLSITGLIDYLTYLKANEQSAQRYELALWRKLLSPITVAVMLLVALSFIFGPLRETSMGARILMGVITGFAFHVSNEIFGPLAQVYQVPAVLGALLPSLVFAGAAVFIMQRKS
ncbi:lipopolysaccharide export system permease protein [Idiomarina fontislapidosi]|uniref:Lipopolysaccharide ABC transporter permease LptG n=1 Tax=Idiomarina fontislapidosi TaxID=263723 RepID=A0A432XUZ4_9GAMM|nr:LPS export ABC transporter permease LptG [Idiomarina fontislapidosi]PYE31806.1 lipopolysaccharide export system permease protein [Idiomarina fontislapidosi]RUO52519.1 lipopolysaccharide ABC transporter permease LptG [Idiomarina fontislapidosi]|tara:strand:+ start:1112 stop:2179 length:1068 start_codon:yes stop_codon:yes gene_type:complete